MREAEFMQLIRDAHERSLETLEAKGKQYALRGEDRLTQFHSVAKSLGASPIFVAVVFAAKHWDSIAQMTAYCQTEFSPSIWLEKLDDLRNYTYFIEALIKEKLPCPAGGTVTSTPSAKA